MKEYQKVDLFYILLILVVLLIGAFSIWSLDSAISNREEQSYQNGLNVAKQFYIAEIEDLKAEQEILEDKYQEAIKLCKNEKQIKQILTCESGNKHEGVFGDGGKSYGIAQFQETTFNWLAEKSNIKGLYRLSLEDQVLLLKWSLDNGYGYLWSCYT
jgi:hypothetical protein